MVGGRRIGIVWRERSGARHPGWSPLARTQRHNSLSPRLGRNLGGGLLGGGHGGLRRRGFGSDGRRWGRGWGLSWRRCRDFGRRRHVGSARVGQTHGLGEPAGWGGARRGRSVGNQAATPAPLGARRSTPPTTVLSYPPPPPNSPPWRGQEPSSHPPQHAAGGKGHQGHEPRRLASPPSRAAQLHAPGPEPAADITMGLRGLVGGGGWGARTVGPASARARVPPASPSLSRPTREKTNKTMAPLDDTFRSTAAGT